MWNVKNDRVMAALAMTMSDKPMAVNMSFQREYAERYEWIRRQFTDLAFTYFTAMLYYEDYDNTSPEERLLLPHGMEAFGGIAHTYRIALLDKPTIIWNFHSFMLGVQMMFSFMLTDSDNPIRICQNCMKSFIVNDSGTECCSTQCENAHKNEKE